MITIPEHFVRRTLFAFMTIFFFASDPAVAMVVFSDNFDAGASIAWGNERGNWRDTGDVYDATNPSNSPVTYSSVTTLSRLTDFSVDVDVNSLDDGGLWLRSSFNGGNINGVLLVTGGLTGTNGGLYWHTVQNGIFSPILSNGPVSGLQGSDISLRIDIVGNIYQAFINGSATASTTLSTSLFASGSVGLFDSSPTSGVSAPRGQTFDNFTITDLTVTSVPEPGTMALFAIGLAGIRLVRRKRRCPRAR